MRLPVPNNSFWLLTALASGAAINGLVWSMDIETTAIPPPPVQAIDAGGPPRAEAAATVVLRPLSDYAETLARPLLQHDRRPPRPREDKAAPAPAPLPVLPDGLRILGVVHEAGGSSRALVSSPELAHGQWIRTGEVIGGWTLTRIGERDVTLSAGQLSRDVPLHTRTPASEPGRGP